MIITGNNNIIRIRDSVSTSVNITMEDNDNYIKLADHFRGSGHSELAAIEGTSIVLGQDCLLSANISVSTGDSHSITNMEGKRINPSRSVVFGDHAWIGNTMLVFKGVTIGSFVEVVLSQKRFSRIIL